MDLSNYIIYRVRLGFPSIIRFEAFLGFVEPQALGILIGAGIQTFDETQGEARPVFQGQLLDLFFQVSVSGTHADTILLWERNVNDGIRIMCRDTQPTLDRLFHGQSSLLKTAMQQYPQGPREDARVGLAGPMSGLGAALITYAVYLVSGWESWAAIARVAAWINLFNLIPVWQLDGSRGFTSLVRPHRWIATAAIALAWFLSQEGMLLLLLIAAIFRAFGREVPDRNDVLILFQYVGLVLAFAWMTTITVPGL